MHHKAVTVKKILPQQKFAANMVVNSPLVHTVMNYIKSAITVDLRKSLPPETQGGCVSLGLVVSHLASVAWTSCSCNNWGNSNGFI